MKVRVEREFAAPVQAVFDAWTHPEVLRRWWTIGDGWQPALVEVDLRPGGRGRLAMVRAGEECAVEGEYAVVERPQRLVYDRCWADGSDHSVVKVRFEERDG